MKKQAAKVQGAVTKAKLALNALEDTLLLASTAKEMVSGGPEREVAAIEVPNIQKAKGKFERTGTADVVVGKHYGVAVKDEGDFISVRFGSNELTEIGSVPIGERNFATRDEAFAFAEQIQNQIKELLGRRGLEILAALGNQP